MKYLLKHLDGRRKLLMREIVESKWDADLVLRSEGLADVGRRKQLNNYLIRRGVEGISPAKDRFEMVGGEAVVYAVIGGEEVISAIHTCKEIPFPISLLLRATRSI